MKLAGVLGLVLLCCGFVWFFFKNPNRPAGSKNSGPSIPAIKMPLKGR
jgi:hypothetical protein